MMRPSTHRAFTLGLWLAAVLAFAAACSKSTTREKTSGNGNAGGASPGNGSTTDNGTGTNTGTGTGTNTGTGTGTGTGGSFSSYMLNETQATELVKTLVLPLRPASEEAPPPHDTSKNNLRDFLSDWMQKIMEKPEMAPGRNFKVTIVRDDEQANASVLNEQVLIYTGLLKVASPTSLAMVLCHEVSHSAKNHNIDAENEYKSYDSKKKTERAAMEKAVNDFIAKAYDPSKQAFTLKKSEVAKVQPTWDAFWKDLESFDKRQEAEADFEGMTICGKVIGFTQSEVAAGFTELFQTLKKLEGDSKIEDGVYKVPEAEVSDFVRAVFGRDTHPTPDERVDQVGRLKKLVPEKPADTTLAASWKNDGAPLAKAFSLTFEDGNDPKPWKTLHDCSGAGHLQHKIIQQIVDDLYR